MCWSLPLLAAIQKQKSKSCLLRFWNQDPETPKSLPKNKKKNSKLHLKISHPETADVSWPIAALSFPWFRATRLRPKMIFSVWGERKRSAPHQQPLSGSLASKPQREFIIKEAQSISLSLSTSLSLSRPLRGEAERGPDSGELAAERRVSEGLINRVSAGYLVSPHPAVEAALMRRLYQHRLPVISAAEIAALPDLICCYNHSNNV